MIGLFSPAFANTYTFTTPPGATEPNDGLPVSASATFVTSTNSIQLTLTNLQANPSAAGQLLSDIFFTAGGVSTGTGLISPTTASYINVAANGTTSAGACCAIWGLSNAGGTYHLNALVGKGAGGTGPHDLIIGPGPYTNANSSIAGNGPHNPFINQSAIFTLGLTGVTSSTIISDVVFSFGTTEGDNVAVPIPAAIWLLASGLLGLIGIARRKQRGALNASSVAA